MKFGCLTKGSSVKDVLMKIDNNVVQLRPENALFKAQELVYDAWEMKSRSKRVALAKKALKISPLCADALVLLAEEETTSSKRIDLYKKAVDVGKDALGKDFEEFKGQFWGFTETRPYMRARFQLALELWLENNESDAIEHLKEMLELNPNDNQGIRYYLVNWLITAGDDKDTKKLFSSYPDDYAANWAYSKTLFVFKQRKESQAEKFFKKAMELNSFVPDYLTGKKDLPELLPHSYSLGSEDEAMIYVEEAREAWCSVDGSVQWLSKQAIAWNKLH